MWTAGTLHSLKDISKNRGDFIALPVRTFTSEATSRSEAMSKRLVRGIAFFLFAVLVGVSATLVAQPYSDEMIQVFPPLGWLSPVSTTMTAVPPVTAADLQEQLKPLAADLALVRRSVEQLGTNLDQLARKQDQLAQSMATLQAAGQQVTQTVSTPPSPPKAVSALLPPRPKAVHVQLPPPKALLPPAQ
jgi:hypothetical protein